VRRDLSGGEWLALLLLGFALVVSLVLGVGVAWMRGVELVQWPSWWSETAVGLGSEAAVASQLDPGSPNMTGLAP
jgi:hypothetical protein